METYKDIVEVFQDLGTIVVKENRNSLEILHIEPSRLSLQGTVKTTFGG